MSRVQPNRQRDDWGVGRMVDSGEGAFGTHPTSTMAAAEQKTPRRCAHCSSSIDRKAPFCQNCGRLTERKYKLNCANCRQDIICDQRLLEEPMECSLCNWLVDLNVYPKLLALQADSQRQREVYEREQRRQERERRRQEKEQRRQEKERSGKERQAKRRAQAAAGQERQQQGQQQRTQQQEHAQALRYAASHVQCKACDVGIMIPQSVYRMSPVVVVIGYLLLVPPILGMVLFALVMFGGTVGALFAGNGGTGASGVGVGLCGFVSSLISGLLGFLLVMRKKILRCNQCGATIAAS